LHERGCVEKLMEEELGTFIEKGLESLQEELGTCIDNGFGILQ